MMEQQSNNNKQNFWMGLLAGVAIVSIIGFVVVLTTGGNKNSSTDKLNVNVPVVNANTNTAPEPTPSGPAGIQATAEGVKTFMEKTGATICKDGDKPVIYLFSTTWCPHCQWVSATFDKVVKEYVAAGKIVAYHWELDTSDDTLTSAVEAKVPAEMEAVYNEFNPGGSIPTFVMGCKYYRVGNGYEAANNLAAEEAEFRAAIDALLK